MSDRTKQKIFKYVKRIMLLTIIMFFVLTGEEHFLLSHRQVSSDTYIMDTQDTHIMNDEHEKVKGPVSHQSFSLEIDAMRQVINILEVDVKDKSISVKPALSFGRLFGFEKLSSIANSNAAYAAVNGGFFYEYGEPAGMVLIDGKLITTSTGRYPVLITGDDGAELKEFDIRIWLETNSREISIHNINREGKSGDIILYTPDYGTDNRIKEHNISVVINDGYVSDIQEHQGSVEIPVNGMILTYIGYDRQQINEQLPQIGTNIKIHTSLELDTKTNAYECGSWLIKDGEIVAPAWDEWVGSLQNFDPRTAVGINKKGSLVFITVDGRQPGYSQGMTSRGLAEFMMSMDIVNAALLDGGASSEMIVQGTIVNRISGDGKERPLGGAMIVQYGK